MSDFTNIVDVGGVFTSTELDEGVDFFDSGEAGTIIIVGSAYGEGIYGEGIYGGSKQSIIITFPVTEWIDIDTP